MTIIHPSFVCSIERRASGTFLVARGPVRPTPMSREYQARLEYQVKHLPRVFIEDPPLQRIDPDKRIEHTFSDNEVCLFRHEFRSDMVLAKTVIPWLLLWLVFYESWRVTGVWQGEGEHPGDAVMPIRGPLIERDEVWRSSGS